MDMMTSKSLECKVLVDVAVSPGLERIVSLLVESVAPEKRIDVVERELFNRLMELGKSLLKLFVEESGDGDVGATVQTAEGLNLKRSPQKQARRYQSIFGELNIERFVYFVRANQKAVVKPLDQRLGLSKQDQSYVLEDWLQRLVMSQPYAEAVESLETLLGVSTSVRSAQRMNRDLANYQASFQADEKLDQPDEELLVVSVDGKGVPMRSSLEQRKHEEYGTKRYQPQNSRGIEKTTKRRTAGANKCTKQTAYVGALFSLKPFARTAEEFLDDLQREQSQQQRPRPTNKRFSVDLTQVHPEQLLEGPQQLFACLQHQVEQRLGSRTLVCLMDGQRSLWYRQRETFPQAVGILDLFHAMEYLWEAAYCFHEKGSKSAEQFVSKELQRLLEGKVRNVIGNFRRRRQKLKGTARKTLDKVIRYYQTNADHMQYDHYIKQGYPVGSGVIEGACRHVVKDRMERSGMRWNIEGATSILKLRTTYLNGHWNQFMEHRIKTEQKQIYSLAI